MLFLYGSGRESWRIEVRSHGGKESTAGMGKLGFVAGIISVMACHPGSAAAAERFSVGDCVGPQVTRFVQGDYQRGVRDQVFGPTPSIMSGPGPAARPTGRRLNPGGAYTVLARTGGDMQLAATNYSEPWPPGAVVGWVRTTEFRELHLRNCN